MLIQTTCFPLCKAQSPIVMLMGRTYSWKPVNKGRVPIYINSTLSYSIFSMKACVHAENIQYSRSTTWPHRVCRNWSITIGLEFGCVVHRSNGAHHALQPLSTTAHSTRSTLWTMADGKYFHFGGLTRLPIFNAVGIWIQPVGCPFHGTPLFWSPIPKVP